jgi:acetoin utilization deacetylase AcuC-like enzyme
MAKKKPFASERIAQCLQVLDTWRASGLGVRAFAQTHQHNYDQMRAWLRHEPRWRQSLGSHKRLEHLEPEHIEPEHFAPVHIQPSVNHSQSIMPSAAQPIRIDCTSQDGKRSASIHFPPVQDSITLSTQWLAAYLST